MASSTSIIIQNQEHKEPVYLKQESPYIVKDEDLDRNGCLYPQEIIEKLISEFSDKKIADNAVYTPLKIFQTLEKYGFSQSKFHFPLIKTGGKLYVIYDPTFSLENIADASKYVLGQGTFGMARLVQCLLSKEWLLFKLISSESYIPIPSAEFEGLQKIGMGVTENVLVVGGYVEYPYIIMKFLPHLDLEKLAKKENYFSEESFVELIIKMAHAIQKLHAEGLLHRDLKLSNFVFNFLTGEVRVIDLGLVLDAEEKPIRNTTRKQGVCNKGALSITAPECRDNRPGRRETMVDYSEASEMYSFGMTIYSLAKIIFQKAKMKNLFSNGPIQCPYERIDTEIFPESKHIAKVLNIVKSMIHPTNPRARISLAETIQKFETLYEDMLPMRPAQRQLMFLVKYSFSVEWAKYYSENLIDILRSIEPVFEKADSIHSMGIFSPSLTTIRNQIDRSYKEDATLLSACEFLLKIMASALEIQKAPTVDPTLLDFCRILLSQIEERVLMMSMDSANKSSYCMR